MNIFEISASATAGIIIPLIALPLIAYLIFIVVDSFVWRLKTMKQHRLEEESKQPPYDEVVITDLKHLGTLYIDLKRDGEVVWSGYSDSFIDGEDSRFRTVRRFTC